MVIRIFWKRSKYGVVDRQRLRSASDNKSLVFDSGNVACETALAQSRVMCYELGGARSDALDQQFSVQKFEPFLMRPFY
jgi:hypothetical protein